MKNEGDWVRIYYAPEATEAAMLVTALQAEGVPCVSAEIQPGGVSRYLSLSFSSPVEVLVPAPFAERGREVLAGLEARRHEQREHHLAWKCTACGESNSASFELCWSCGSERS